MCARLFLSRAREILLNKILKPRLSGVPSGREKQQLLKMIARSQRICCCKFFHHEREA
jgi:hypothetical protein